MSYTDNQLRDELLKLYRYSKRTGAFVDRATRKQVRMSDTRGYLRIQHKGKTYYQHRLVFLFVTGHFPSGQVDHKNGNYSDNRWSNLREANAHQNGANRKLGSNNFSGCKGVHYIRGIGKWRADIQVQRCRFVIGNYVDWEEAVIARQMAEIACFGEFARVAQ